METLTTNSDLRNETRETLPSESTHWYDKNGNPVYEVEAKKGGMRATTIADARKLGLVPSVTNILNIAAKPGLEAWKAKQILESSLTLPRHIITKVVNGVAVVEEELLDDYAVRVMEDAKSQSKKAMERGTQLHAAIEDWIRGQLRFQYQEHIANICATLNQLGIDLREGKAEHSFASQLGYGGKIDFHNEEPLIIDFKTRATIDDKKQLSWPEHVQQLAAYGFGMGYGFVVPKFRALNVFIGVEDKQVRIIEHSRDDLEEAFKQFQCLLEYWKRIKKFGTIIER